MNAKQLTRELRRIARREVPDREPNLWPAIRSRIAPATPGMGSMGGHANDVSSVYVWSADERSSRFGSGARALAAVATLVLVVAVLAVVLSNRGDNGDNRQILSGAGSSPTASSGIATPSPTATAAPALNWPRNGKLVVPILPLADSGITGDVSLQILPTRDIRFSFDLDIPQEITTWHVVPQSCAALAGMHEHDVDGKDVISPFLLTDGTIEFIPAGKTHQPLTMVAFARRDGTPMACAPVPKVPGSLAMAFNPAPTVPRTCPVTVPSQPVFAPDGQPVDPPHPIYGDYWYGTNELYTGLAVDGVWSGRQKVLWWLTSHNWNTQPVPAITVTGKRLDGDAPPATIESPTTEEGGMMVKITFPTTGCWQISGAHREHTLSFVVWVNDLSSVQFNQAPGPIPTTTPTPGADGLTHTDQQCRANSFGPSSARPSDVNVELRGTASSGQFWALLYQQMPISAQQPVQFAWKIDSPDKFTITFEDTEGQQIGPTAYTVGPLTSSNWPRPGTEWHTGVFFPHSGCWHAHAQAGDVTGDMWFEVFSPAVTPPATATPAANPVATPGTSGTSTATCPNVSDLEPNADFSGYGLAHAGPLWFSGFDQTQSGKAVVAGFSPGFPTKMLIHQDHGLQDSVELRGSDCSTGQVLHFCYPSTGTCGFTGQRVSEAELSQRGDPVVTILADVDYTGYILFPKPGIYRLWVEQNGAEIGSVVVQVPES